MNEKEIAQHQLAIEAFVKSAKLLQQLFITRPKFLERFSIEQTAAVTWVLDNFNTNSDNSNTTAAATDLEVPSGWLKNYARAVEFAESIVQTLPKLQKIKGESPYPLIDQEELLIAELRPKINTMSQSPVTSLPAAATFYS